MNRALRMSDLNAILARAAFPGYTFLAYEVKPPFLFSVYARFSAEDADVPGVTRCWYTREYLVHADSTEAEVFGTLMLLVLTSVEHEARERFLVDGKKAHGPHEA